MIYCITHGRLLPAGIKTVTVVTLTDLDGGIIFAWIFLFVQVFNTYSNEDYDRRNEEVDPVASSAEYELEKRVEKLELFPVELEKGDLLIYLFIYYLKQWLYWLQQLDDHLTMMWRNYANLNNNTNNNI